MKYRKKPIVVDAYQFFGRPDDRANPPGMVMLTTGNGHAVLCDKCGRDDNSHAMIRTLEGNMVACPGDWIITGVQGERYPCKPDIFELTYEPCES